MKPKTQKNTKLQKQKILNQIPIFLAKTYRIVDNRDYANTIEWIQQGNGFIVKSITDLTQKIFIKHFKHTKYASFIRQLNLYGFHKMRYNEDGQVFTHECFSRDNIELLLNIKRRNAPPEIQKNQKRNASQLALVQMTGPSTLMLMPNMEPTTNYLEKELSALTQKHESLQNLVSILVEQNKQIIMQNKSFINKMNSHDDGYRKKLQIMIFLMVFGLKNGDESNNIIVPPQLNNMIKAFTSGKKDKKVKQPNQSVNVNTSNMKPDSISQAVQLFKRPADQTRFNNKKIQQILQMLRMEGGDADISQGEDQKQDNDNGLHFEKKSSNFSNISDESYLQDNLSLPLSPIASLRSLSSRYLQDGRVNDDWNDFLDRLQASDVEIQQKSE